MTTGKPNHILELEAWLGAHAHRRRNDRPNGSLMGPTANVWQYLSRMEALYKCLIMLERERGVDLTKVKVLDVGCSYGSDGLAKMMALNFSAGQLYGIDILEDRIKGGRETYPGLNLYHGDATDMRVFDDGYFDIVMESFCLCHIADDNVRERIAREMVRVTKVRGHILIFDWRVGRRAMNINALPLKKIKAIFDVGKRTTLIKRYSGQLVPLIGRRISTFAPMLYPLVQRSLPFLVGSKLTVLVKL